MRQNSERRDQKMCRLRFPLILRLVVCIFAVARLAMGQAESESTIGIYRGKYLRTTDSRAHCGIYSLCGVLKSLGIEPEIDQLMSKEYIGSDLGSSSAELIAAARSQGTDAVGFRQLSVSSLRRLRSPALLYLRGGKYSENTYHWVAFLGEHEGKARIFDAPHPVQEISYPTLLAFWTGEGLVVIPSERKLNALGFALSDRIRLVPWVLLIIVVSMAFHWAGNRWSHYRTSHRFLHVGATEFILLVLAGVVAFAWHSFHPYGIYKNPAAVGMVSRNYYAYGNYANLDTSEVEKGLSDRTIQLIDARMPHAYASGHLPSAIAFPVDAALGEIDRAIERVDLGKHLVVYCQSEHCEWSHRVASWLTHAGCKRVGIYRPGYVGWVADGMPIEVPR